MSRLQLLFNSFGRFNAPQDAISKGNSADVVSSKKETRELIFRFFNIVEDALVAGTVGNRP